MDCHQLLSPNKTPIFYCGPSLSDGPLPAFFYFALAGDESLLLEPYNHPVLPFENAHIRVFSLTLPSHGPGFNKFHAMEDWMRRLEKGEQFLETFFEETLLAIEWLIDSHIIDPSKMAVGGLSRGGFIATHLAAREKRFHTLLGFAPLTKLGLLSEYHSGSQELEKKVRSFDLDSIIPSLLHLNHTRFYMGNHDTRVGTDACYQFIRNFVDAAHEKHLRNCNVELFLTPSIGHKGHGTAPHVFEEGARWIQKNLLGEL